MGSEEEGRLREWARDPENITHENVHVGAFESTAGDLGNFENTATEKGNFRAQLSQEVADKPLRQSLHPAGETLQIGRLSHFQYHE